MDNNGDVLCEALFYWSPHQQQSNFWTKRTPRYVPYTLCLL